MYKQGVILELRGREAIVFNNAGEYEKIKRLEGMTVGQVVKYNKAINNRANRILQAVSVAAVLIAVLFSYSIFKASREQVFAYVTLDMDPSMEFSINSANDVLGVRSINHDAEEITKSLEVKGKKINAVVSEVMEKMEKLGYINSDKTTVILLSTAANASLDKDDKRNVQIDKTMASIKETVKNCTKNQAYVEAISSTSEIRNLSIKADMSLGRYVLYTKVLEQGEPISVQDAKIVPLSQLVKKAEIDQDNSDIADTSPNSPDNLSQANKPTLGKNADEDKLGTDKPGIDKPEIDRPVTDKPEIDKPEIDKPGIDRPETDRPEIDKSVADKPAVDKPAINKPVIDRPVIDRPVIDRPVIDKPVIDKPEIDKPVIDRPVIDKPVIDKPVTDKPVIDKPVTDKPVTDKPVIDKPVIDKPIIDKPVIDKPIIDKPIIDKPVIDKPVIGESGTEKPLNNKSDVIPAPVATVARADDDRMCRLAASPVPACTNEIPEPTPGATEPFRLRERRGWQRTLTP